MSGGTGGSSVAAVAVAGAVPPAVESPVLLGTLSDLLVPVVVVVLLVVLVLGRVMWGAGSSDATIDEKKIVRSKDSYPFVESRSIRVPCPACGREVRNTRGNMVGHWKRTCDAGGVTRTEFREAVIGGSPGPDSLPESALRSAADEGGSTRSTDRTRGSRAEDIPERMTDIKGVDRSVADRLRAAGYESVGDLRRASKTDLMSVGVIGGVMAARIEAAVGDASTDTDDTSGPAAGRDGADDRLLTDVSGVGPEEASALCDAGYTSVAALRRASQSDLAGVDGIGNALAARVKADAGDLSNGEANSDDEDADDPQESTSEKEPAALDRASITEDHVGWLVVDGGGRRVDCPSCGSEVYNEPDAFVSHWDDKPDCSGVTAATLARLTGDPDAADDVPTDVLRDDGTSGGRETDEPDTEEERDEAAVALSDAEAALDRVEAALGDGDPDAAGESLDEVEDRLSAATDLLSELQATETPDKIGGIRDPIEGRQLLVDDDRGESLRDAGYSSVGDLRAASVSELAAVEEVDEEFATRVKTVVGEELVAPDTGEDTPSSFLGPVSDLHARQASAVERLREFREQVRTERAREAVAEDRERAADREARGDEYRENEANEGAVTAYTDARGAYATVVDRLPEDHPDTVEVETAIERVAGKLAAAAAEPDRAAAADAVQEAESLASAGEYEDALERLDEARERYEAAITAAREHDPEAEIIAECETSLSEVEESRAEVTAEHERARVERHVQDAEEHHEAGDDHLESGDPEAALTAYTDAIEAYDAALAAAGDAYGPVESIREARATAERDRAVAERDAGMAAAEEAVAEAETDREAERYEAALSAYDRAGDRLAAALAVAGEHDLDGVEVLRDRIESVEREATACELSALSERIAGATDRAPAEADGAERELEAVLDRLEALETDRERDVSVLRDAARQGLVTVARARGERHHESARDLFAAGDHDAARAAFEDAEAAFGTAVSRAREHDLDVDTEALAGAESVAADNADAARQAFYGLEDGQLSLRSLPWEDGEFAAGVERMAGERASTQGNGAGWSPGGGGSPGQGADQRSVASTVTASLPEYDAREWIGSGGSADVYRVETGDGEVAALKVPRWEGTMHASAVDEFVREAETWAKLDSHDHIADVLDWGTEPYPWLLLEYLPGSLAGVEGLSVDERLDALIAVADALEYAHGRGVVHQDVKPENVLLTDDGVPKVCDWGLARAVLEAPEAGGMTPAYAAPEQLEPGRGVIDRRTDVYQAGVLSYEVLTGRQPFTGEGALELRRAILESTPRPPSAGSELPPALDDVLLRAMAADPAARYETCIQFRDDLRAVREGSR